MQVARAKWTRRASGVSRRRCSAMVQHLRSSPRLRGAQWRKSIAAIVVCELERRLRRPPRRRRRDGSARLARPPRSLRGLTRKASPLLAMAESELPNTEAIDAHELPSLSVQPTDLSTTLQAEAVDAVDYQDIQSLGSESVGSEGEDGEGGAEWQAAIEEARSAWTADEAESIVADLKEIGMVRLQSASLDLTRTGQVHSQVHHRRGRLHPQAPLRARRRDTARVRAGRARGDPARAQGGHHPRAPPPRQA